MWVGIGVFGMDPMAFLTGVTAPFIFGTIIVLNMLQNSLFAIDVAAGEGPGQRDCRVGDRASCSRTCTRRSRRS